MSTKVYLAVDLGAESGRVMAGLWNGRTLRLQEVHRFQNGPVWWADSMRWDVVRLWAEIQNGLAAAAREHGPQIVSVGTDTWGVDFALLSRRGELLAQPWHYRDARTDGMLARAFRMVPRAEIFRQTGIQFMQINTLYQLLAMRRSHPDLLEHAGTLLMMPDLFHWLLCGSKVVEFTDASTSQCVNPVRRAWARGLLKKFGIPTHIFPAMVQPGTDLGPLRRLVAERAGLPPTVRVVAPPTHDTASAVAGVPSDRTGRTDWAYLSSGTWSLMGVEMRRPVLTDRALELNMTNEGGVDGTVRLLKNIMGLWLVQQCRRSFEAAGRSYTYAELVRLAAEAPPLRSLVDPDDPRFLNPPDMPRAIQSFCQDTGQPVPKSDGELVRCAYESLALKYRQVLGHLEELAGNRIEVIHIVGGGSQNDLLNQFTADACQRQVRAGPVEATALGNLLVQIRASGEIGSLEEIREAVRRSCEMRTFDPGDGTPWAEAAARWASFRRRA
ncbi:MAG: rhamnulokinase [Kiritimatiellae bacterium]|nr:rhamnulokinase [Kiritimatiellia bacterium]